MLIELPVHVLVFDSGLLCRYAAPSGPHFLGWTAEALLGAPAAKIFPADVVLAPQIERVLLTRSSWLQRHLAYAADPGGAWDAGAWDVYLQPWTLASEQPEPAGERASGVLMSCLPCEAAGLAGDDERVARLLDGIRNQLTVIGGFAGLLRRRAGGDADPAVERIGRAVVALGLLLEQYEAATRAP